MWLGKTSEPNRREIEQEWGTARLPDSNTDSKEGLHWPWGSLQGAEVAAPLDFCAVRLVSLLLFTDWVCLCKIHIRISGTPGAERVPLLAAQMIVMGLPGPKSQRL